MKSSAATMRAVGGRAEEERAMKSSAATMRVASSWPADPGTYEKGGALGKMAMGIAGKST